MNSKSILSAALISAALLASGLSADAKTKVNNYTVASPNKALSVKVSVGDGIEYNVTRGGKTVLSPSKIALKLEGRTLGQAEKAPKVTKSTASSIEKPLFYRQASISNSYNQIDLYFASKGFGVQFRAYDSGIAYRFYTNLKQDQTVKDEIAEFNFPGDYGSWIACTKDADHPYATSFENIYTVGPVSKMLPGCIAFTPTLFDIGGGAKMTITESDIESYPGMFLAGNGKGVKGQFAPVPLQIDKPDKRGKEKVATYCSYIAKTEGTRNYPWRIVSIAASDKDILADNLVYLLGGDNRLVNTIWIKPGKVAWDWWNDWGITGVPFKAGINNDTYKAYIDFAAKNHIEYVVLDEGWSPVEGHDIMKSIPEIDLDELVRYANSKNVGLILWAVSYVLDKKLDEAFKYYSGMGIKGFKVDFIDRDDQQAVDMVERISQKAADYHLVLDFHGMFKPAGLNRRYPNILNFEGVFGEEQVKWEKDLVHPEYDVTFPYIRMFSGPVDYTQGAMRNGTRTTYQSINSQPMSQGTRAHQIAEYIIFDSPLEMLCDAPSSYEKEQATCDFITSIPVIWDETKVVSAEVGKYIVVLRRKGSDYYIGATGNWDEHDLCVDLSFLGKGKFNATVYRDGANAGKIGEDFVLETKSITSDNGLKIHLAPGGGYACKITKEQ